MHWRVCVSFTVIEMLQGQGRSVVPTFQKDSANLSSLFRSLSGRRLRLPAIMYCPTGCGMQQ